MTHSVHRRWAAACAIAIVPALLGLAPAAGATTGPNDPIGHLDQATAVGQSGIAVTGWAADPDLLSQSLMIAVSVDGVNAGQVLSDLARPDATAARGAGPKAGFGTTVRAAPGPHLVCASAVNLGLGADAPLGCISVTVPGLTPAQIAAHSPIGALDRAAASGAAIMLTGWAADPDGMAQPLRITSTVDGRPGPAGKLLSLARPDVAKYHHTGPNQGYQLTTGTLANGVHTVCAVAGNLLIGADRTLGCASLRVGPIPLTPAQIAAHSPSGSLEGAQATGPNSLQVTGWASDPDNPGHPLTVVAYLDGSASRTAVAIIARPDLVSRKVAGLNSGFGFAVPTSVGAHNVCVWAVNIGIGNNVFLGCRAQATPAVAMPTGPAPATPGANIKVTALAAKYLGSRYVWGGASPATGFDCSGLVQYTYRTAAGITTPRTAQDQFTAARMITQGRAVAGDLVFFHDSVGSVYHVGIYIGHGMMYAAVDPAEGVRQQQIWDPTATFGSFTHS